MIDHISTYALEYQTTMAFYRNVFQPLGIKFQTEIVTDWDTQFPNRRCGAFGQGDKASFWIIETREQSTPRHIAFSAFDHHAVEAFYHCAIQSGARSNGAPGYRTEYHPHYYAAFVIDPDGNDIEAVCHQKIPIPQ